MLAALACLILAGCDEQPRFGSGDGDSDSDSDSDSDTDSDSDSDPPQTETIVLQNGLSGYEGCVDTAASVPEGAAWMEITPQDEMMWIYHDVWTGS
jgi:hypothetical protein